MANGHRTNVMVSSCLKTPVDPRTKAPLASYERERALPHTAPSHMDNRDQEKEVKTLHNHSAGSPATFEFKGFSLHQFISLQCHLDLTEIFLSNEEYYSKLEELKKAHLHTMAELENLYRQKLQLKALDQVSIFLFRQPWSNTSPAASRGLRKSRSAVELRRSSGHSDLLDEDEAACDAVEKGLLFSPKEHIKNMWRDFKMSPHNRKKRQGLKDGEQEHWKHRVTVPKPFQMTLREAGRQKLGSEIELQNAELRRQLEELTECQRKFHASPVPAHVHLPLYDELQERNEERRQNMREREKQHLQSIQKPFSFLERERLKKEQNQLRHPQPSDQERIKPFKAKPVPKAVYAAASGEQMKEEQLYRSIKIQMRAQELLHSASMPPSMLARQLSQRKTKDGSAAAGGDNSFTHRPLINKEVPDFNASYRRFQKHLEKRKEVKPTTACEPFELRTSQISSHREHILADIEQERRSPWMQRWPHISPRPAHTPNSSLCSSLSGSMELLPAKVTDATKKRHERQKEYQQEVREMRQRVKGRPLLLEQVAQVDQNSQVSM
uniref:Protein FAM161A n=1 Tax=Monopterus albus TaxID=43700 RepID=A0A3Q3J1Y4_MONAL